MVLKGMPSTMHAISSCLTTAESALVGPVPRECENTMGRLLEACWARTCSKNLIESLMMLFSSP
jgi:hypothetical protein